jgi:alkylation response protein AidB-like acyl-CoA dehydrogenase
MRRSRFLELPSREVRAIAAARSIGATAFSRAPALDTDDGFPALDIAELRGAGLLLAPFAHDHGGSELGGSLMGASALLHVLRALGGGNLALGRIYEGHVNAVLLVRRYGSVEQIRRLAKDVGDGAILGVWNAEIRDRPVTLRPIGPGRKLNGTKILASGAGRLSRPLVTARDEGGGLVMVMPRLDKRTREDLSRWKPQGMRASATGSFDLNGLKVTTEDIVGEPNDYLREPFFSAGAWRFCAVQLGAIEALVEIFRRQLCDRGREADQFQRMRMAECAAASETARLWVERAALMSTPDRDAQATVAYVDLARLVVERAALEVMDRVQRGIGLDAFMRPNPVERIGRDLRTYLRQPAPDAAMLAAADTIFRRDGPIVEIWEG